MALRGEVAAHDVGTALEHDRCVRRRKRLGGIVQHDQSFNGLEELPLFQQFVRRADIVLAFGVLRMTCWASLIANAVRLSTIAWRAAVLSLSIL